MSTWSLPATDVMRRAFLSSDESWDGLFVVGVPSTGIFCRPGCPARKPRSDGLSYFATPREAVRAGFRSCRRCRPERPVGEEPEWVSTLLGAVDREPGRRWSEADLESLGVSPSRVRRWSVHTFGMSFMAYARARRLGWAFSEIRRGRAVGRVAIECGYDSLSGFQSAFRKLFGGPPTDVRDDDLLRIAPVPTPLGLMLAGVRGERLLVLEYVGSGTRESVIERLCARMGLRPLPLASDAIASVRAQLREYHAGARAHFDLPLEPSGTCFQRSVWEAVSAIPFGETRTYGALAATLGAKSAARALGTAIARNPLELVVPCHRVVGSDGGLTGYAGGLWRKRRLLEMERRNLETGAVRRRSDRHGDPSEAPVT